MDHRSEGSGAAVVIVLILFLVLLVGGAGVGVFIFFGRQQTSLAMQVQQARMAEMEARMMAEQARDEAVRAAQLRQAAAVYSAVAAGDPMPSDVEAILRAQETAWNKGDLDAFMEHYWNSESLTFSSGGETKRGWQETMNRYREKYPTPEKMGRLALKELEITPLGDSAALVLGKWSVERDSEPLSGNFSLVVRKIDGRWQIVHDHTSRAMGEK